MIGCLKAKFPEIGGGGGGMNPNNPYAPPGSY
jgi:hypothetical protein